MSIHSLPHQMPDSLTPSVLLYRRPNPHLRALAETAKRLQAARALMARAKLSWDEAPASRRGAFLDMVNEVATILERRPEQIPPVCQGDIPQLYVSRAADVVGELSDLMAKGEATDAAEYLALVLQSTVAEAAQLEIWNRR